MSDVATFGDILAVETQSSETQFWLVQVTARAYRRAQAIRLPGAVTASSEATFEFAGNKPAVKTRRLKPITVARGGNSTRIYEIDEKLPPFFVPSRLARMGYIPATYRQEPPQRRGRSGVVGPGKDRLEISAATKARVLGVCCCFDEWG